jgi:hypothetical protein
MWMPKILHCPETTTCELDVWLGRRQRLIVATMRTALHVLKQTNLLCIAYLTVDVSART